MQGNVFPRSLEAERALLGGLMKNQRELLAVAEVVSAEDFYSQAHGKLFQLFIKMHGEGVDIDQITVPERVQRAGQAQDYGDVAYVLSLPEQAPATSNLLHYAQLIQQKATLRRLISVSETLRDEAYLDPEDLSELLDKAEREVFAVSQRRDVREWAQMSQVIDDEFLRIQELSQRTGEVTGLTTGFLDLDQKLAGLQKSDLLILAARPAMGKTALALNIAQNAAMLGGAAVGLFSMEMSRGQLVTRMICCEGLVDAGRVRTGRLEPDDWDRLLESSEALRKARVYIDDTPGLSITELKAKARRLASEDKGLGLIVIDYLQLMSGDDKRAPREQQISSISRGLKGLAKDLDIPVIALSQLNRGVEKREDKRPMVSDLRESGAIEQDADIIMFIYRDEYYNEDTPDKGLAEVIIAKQRNGPTGTVKLVFQGQYSRFDNWTSEGDIQI